MTAPPITRPSPQIPWWSWPNVLSIDAVAIGALWQLLFTIEFLGRLPTMAEAGIISLSIWLAYTADRLLDSMVLDCRLPHTLRHRFHFEHRDAFVAAWCVVLAIDVALIWQHATASQLRWGIVATAVVLAYALGVHVSRPARRWVPKELQAGMAFAFGVSLTAWSETDSAFIELFVSTLLAGSLFSANCLAVACIERWLDLRQGFSSWPTQDPGFARRMPIHLQGHLWLTILALLLGVVPSLMGTCLITGSVLMLIVLSKAAPVACRDRGQLRASPPSACPFGALADLAIAVPPAALIPVLLVLP